MTLQEIIATAPKQATHIMRKAIDWEYGERDDVLEFALLHEGVFYEFNDNETHINMDKLNDETNSIFIIKNTSYEVVLEITTSLGVSDV
jgi:hypothetical protein